MLFRVAYHGTQYFPDFFFFNRYFPYSNPKVVFDHLTYENSHSHSAPPWRSVKLNIWPFYCHYNRVLTLTMILCHRLASTVASYLMFLSMSLWLCFLYLCCLMYGQLSKWSTSVFGSVRKNTCVILYFECKSAYSWFDWFRLSSRISLFV